MATVHITLNGKPHALPAGTSLQTLLERLEVTGRVAVELNAEVIRRARHPDVLLCEGDRVELVTFVGGGA